MENTTKKNEFIDSISNQILNGKLEKNYLFVTTLNEMNSFKFLLKNKDFIIKKLDGYFLVFNKKQTDKEIRFDEKRESIGLPFFVYDLQFPKLELRRAHKPLGPKSDSHSNPE